MPTLIPDRRACATEAVAQAAGIVASLVGVLVLAGWMWDIDRLKRIVPGLVSMNPMTAAAFILAGVSLWLQRRPPASSVPPSQILWRRIAQTCALLVLCVGVMKLTYYLFGWDVGIDQVLFSEKLLHDDPSFPNRIAPNTALNFIFLGLSLVLLDVTTCRGRRPSEFFAIAMLFFSLLALIGYAYRVKWLYEVGTFIPMALHTAVLFHIIALGILCARAGGGLMAVVTSTSPGGVTARRLIPGMVLILFILGWLRLEGERRGFYGAELGVTLYTVASITLFGALIWWSAKSLHRADAEQKRAEAERERFFTLSLDMLCIASTDGYFKRLNPAFQRTLGYTTEELLARPFLDFVHPDDRAATLAEVEKLKQGVPTIKFENRYQCKNGAWKWLSWKCQPFLSEGLLYATGHDITKEKETEAAIQQLNADLEQRAGQLQAANKELEAFSYSVSHDLRAPLRHIDGFLELLQKKSGTALDAKCLRYANLIAESAKEMGTLIDDLLSFSRMGRAEMRAAPLNLEQLVRDTIKGLEQETAGRDITWKIGALPHVRADVALLRQVLINLISNALKYSRTRPCTEIEIGSRADESGDPVVFIRDNGVGFDMKYADKLFGVFQRLHEADEFEGTGIGLANVQRIIGRHGGRTWAEGAVNAGATFYFSLPKSPLLQP